MVATTWSYQNFKYFKLFYFLSLPFNNVKKTKKNKSIKDFVSVGHIKVVTFPLFSSHVHVHA